MQFMEFLQRCLWGRRERKSFLPDGEGGMPRRGRGAGRAANAGVHGGGGERMLRSGARITFRNLSAFLGFWETILSARACVGRILPGCPKRRKRTLRRR